ncbi:MAG TPA: DMT family transporter [Chthoniobacteraceae bacterium]|jgi:drug/metabolite transporter (DMT)-like permease
MSLTSPLLIPLVSAFGYPIAAMMLKRATENGGGPWRVTFITNWVLAACFSVLWLFPTEHPVNALHLFHAFISGLLFFVGQIFTFLALSRGDVSVATPVLGSKVIFVALFTVLLGAAVVTPAMWLAVVLTAIATALLGSTGKVQRAALLRSLVFGFSAAAAFGLTDVLQQRWVPLWGFSHFAAAMFLFVALLSFTLIPFFGAPLSALPAPSWRWAVGGGATLAVQAGGIAWSIVYVGATTTNVLYNSRGLWSVVLVWTVGHWFGNSERARGGPVMICRLCGSALLLAAIALIAR